MLEVLRQASLIVFALVLAIPWSGLAVAERPETQLEFSRWSGDVNVPDPVAISLDREGRAYVTQTQRRKANDLDIRANRDWIINDNSFQSVADKRDFYHERLAPGAHDPKNKDRVEDLNDDGSHDYRDLMVLTEKILRLEDTDGDGTADSIHVFAEDFRTEVAGIAAGVLHHDGHVYTTIAPDVWRLTDTDSDGTADQRAVIATGFGLHIAYAGHDMHGLTVGPDGRIYWSIGDKGISVTTDDGRRFHYPNQGGVMRCNPDGSGFEVFAHGLRNVQEPAFDQFGNFFGVDNDSDQRTERERFVYIVKGMDAGWRSHYQYRGGDYNPWMDEKLCVPYFEGQPAYIVAPISHSIDGPAGFAFNPGTALSPNYRDYFFLTGAPNGNQIAFQVEPAGASFQMVNEHPIGSGIPLVGINFGPDGALYGVDWGGGYPLNQTGAVWKIDVPAIAESPLRREVAELLEAGPRDRSEAELVVLLSHPDQRIRLDAQFELVRRQNAAALQVVAKDESADQLARVHSVWGLGQLARAGDFDSSVFAPLLSESDVQVRVAALRTIGDLDNFDGRLLVPLLNDSDPRIRFHAMQALAEHSTPDAFPKLVELADRQQLGNIYLRHAVCRALAVCATPLELAELASHSSVNVRVCAVVALRHETSPAVARFLGDKDSVVADEAARAIHDDFSITEALQELATTLLLPGNHSEAFQRRAINAALRLGSGKNAIDLAAFATDERAPVAMRLTALDALSEWKEPCPLDAVTGRFRDFSERKADVPTELAGPLTPLLLAGEPQVQVAAMKAMRSLKIPLDPDTLLAVARRRDSPASLVVEALNSLEAQGSDSLDDVIALAVQSSDAGVKIRGLELLAAHQHDRALPEIMAALGRDQPVAIRQKAAGLLADIGTPEADLDLLTQFKAVHDSLGSSAIALELLEGLEQRCPSNSDIATAFESTRESLVTAAASAPEAAFAVSLTGGDPATGKRLFNTHLEAQCVRCHRVGDEGSAVGPDLSDIATKRDRQHLLRAIVAPSADIDEKYRTQVAIMASGKVIQGVRVRETDDVLVLADAQGKEIELPKEDIDDLVEQKTSIMPEMTKTLSLREIRDLVAYLSTLKN